MTPVTSSNFLNDDEVLPAGGQLLLGLQHLGGGEGEGRDEHFGEWVFSPALDTVTPLNSAELR